MRIERLVSFIFQINDKLRAAKTAKNKVMYKNLSWFRRMFMYQLWSEGIMVAFMSTILLNDEWLDRLIDGGWTDPFLQGLKALTPANRERLLSTDECVQYMNNELVDKYDWFMEEKKRLESSPAYLNFVNKRIKEITREYF